MNCYIILFLVISNASLQALPDINNATLIHEMSELEDFESKALRNQEEFNRPYIAISLGIDCTVAMNLRYWKISEYAFPLNWVVTPIHSLFSLFQHNFENLFDKTHLHIEGIAHPGNIGVYDTVYGVHSRHDFLEAIDFESQYTAIKNKYENRVKRLDAALKSGKKVYLVRWHMSQAKAIELSNVISKMFPQLDYTLAVVGTSKEHKIQWNHPRIKNYFLALRDKQTNIDAWGSIFKDLGLR